MAHLDVPVVRCRALQVVVDLLMWHGLSAFISDTAPEDDDDAKSDDGLSTFTQDTNVQVSQSVKTMNKNKIKTTRKPNFKYTRKE